MYANGSNERTGTLVTAPRKNAELNPRPGHGHRGVRRGNVWLATIGTLIERLFQNTYAFVSLSSPSVPVRSLPLYHPLFFSFRFFPLFLWLSFSLLPALLRLALTPYLASAFPCPALSFEMYRSAVSLPETSLLLSLVRAPLPSFPMLVPRRTSGTTSVSL